MYCNIYYAICVIYTIFKNNKEITTIQKVPDYSFERQKLVTMTISDCYHLVMRRWVLFYQHLKQDEELHFNLSLLILNENRALPLGGNTNFQLVVKKGYIKGP